MANKIQCETHGECDETFVCSHLAGETAGLGFNGDEPSEDKPFPDAWCDDCELIRAAHNGWNEESEKLSTILLLCSGCYRRARIRNTLTTLSLSDLDNLRWKCGSCEEWHTGPCLDFSYDSPDYWQKEHDEGNNRDRLLPDSSSAQFGTFLNADYCAIEDRDFFVRGNIHLPIVGSAETFRWGVWGSLSRESFVTLLRMKEDPRRVELPPMFSWLSTQIKGYPDTLSLKMYAHIQEPGWRPNFELEQSDHPLSQEYHGGITVEEVKIIIMGRWPNEDQV
jgi:hypothetical protein